MQSAFLTALRRVPTPKGDVLHGMKAGDPGFTGFGEAYFSTIAHGAIKGWKRHREMTLNLVCPFGAVRFVVHDGGGDPATWLDVTLSPDTAELYRRLTVPPMLWVAFEGVGAENIVLNVADRRHDPQEAETADLSVFAWPAAKSTALEYGAR
jgi:dTDP-4-dehydrorhamnose 3,5-epimerase